MLPERSDPNNALGAPDDIFFSLGFGGYITVGFAQSVANGPGSDVLVVETTSGSYPLERAEVWVWVPDPYDPHGWVFVGVVDNAGQNTVSIPPTVKEFAYVKIVDISDPSLFEPDADGFDLNAVGVYYISWWFQVFAYNPSGEFAVSMEWSTSPQGWSGTGTTYFAVHGLWTGTSVTLSAPAIVGDYEFDYWEISGVWPNPTTPTVTFTIGVGVTLRAYYKLGFITVGIDIKPGSLPNSVNLGDQGVLPVAIFGSSTFDVTTINPATIKLGSVGLAMRGPAKAPKPAYSYEDVNDDGFMDLVAFFRVDDLVSNGALTPTTTSLTLTAQLNTGTWISGTDSVSIVPP